MLVYRDRIVVFGKWTPLHGMNSFLQLPAINTLPITGAAATLQNCFPSCLDLIEGSERPSTQGPVD